MNGLRNVHSTELQIFVCHIISDFKVVLSLIYINIRGSIPVKYTGHIYFHHHIQGRSEIHPASCGLDTDGSLCRIQRFYSLMTLLILHR